MEISRSKRFVPRPLLRHPSPRPRVPQADELRVVASSTFRDLQEEREHPVEEISSAPFSSLRHALLHHHLHTTREEPGLRPLVAEADHVDPGARDGDADVR